MNVTKTGRKESTKYCHSNSCRLKDSTEQEEEGRWDDGSERTSAIPERQ